MTSANDEPPERATGSATSEFGRLVQGVILDRFAIGGVLFALVVIGAGFLEASGAVRVLAVLVGFAVAAVIILGWRRKWSDPVMWALLVSTTVLQFGIFFLAVR